MAFRAQQRLQYLTNPSPSIWLPSIDNMVVQGRTEA